MGAVSMRVPDQRPYPRDPCPENHGYFVPARNTINVGQVVTINNLKARHLDRGARTGVVSSPLHRLWRLGQVKRWRHYVTRRKECACPWSTGNFLRQATSPKRARTSAPIKARSRSKPLSARRHTLKNPWCRICS